MEQQQPYHFETQKLVSRLYRDYYGKMVAALTRYFGLQQLDIAEDLVQETFEAAISNWSEKGVPQQPANWLFKACKNKTINWLRKKRFSGLPDEKLLNSGEELRLGELFLDHEIEDSQLRMMVACCHYAFSVKNQLIFVLRHIGGLTVRQIARGLLMTEEAVSKSVVRSKQLIRDQHLQFPEAGYHVLRQKLPEVHLILYLLFNEGYAATEGSAIVREELCFEAIRLVKLLTRSELENSDSHALLALFLFHASRFPAREAADGTLVDLESQDRSLWDSELIQLAVTCFKKSVVEKTYSKYQVEAAIAFEHAKAATFEQTNWPLIVDLYAFLLERDPSPAVHLNWLIAVFYSQGAEKAYEKLVALETKGLLTRNQYFFSLMGKIYQAMGDTVMAGSCYRQAIELTASLPEKKHLERLIAAL